MIVDIYVHALATDVVSGREAPGEWLGALTVLNTDSKERALAHYMDADPAIAKVIEDGLAYIEVVDRTTPPSNGLRLKAPDPSWFGTKY